MSLSELINESCPICSNNLFLGNPGNPVDITSCHHKFHNNCLYRWCNNNQRNILARCSCPSCRRAFNFNNELNDLNETVKRDLLKALVNGDYNNLSPEDKNALQEIINQNNSEAPTQAHVAQPVTQNANFLAMNPQDFAMMLLNDSIIMEQDTEDVARERQTIQRDALSWLREMYELSDENLLNEQAKQQLILYLWNRKINQAPRGRYGDDNTPQEILNMTPSQFANHILERYITLQPEIDETEFLEQQREEINDDEPLVWLENAYIGDDDYGVRMNRELKKMYENYIINQINQINQPRRGGKTKKRVTKRRRVKKSHSRRH